MLDFLKKGIEFNKVAQSFGIMYDLINLLHPLIDRNKHNLEEFKAQHKTDILILAYIAHKGVITRLDKYNWGFEAKIMVPSISLNRITVMNAWSQTITKMNIMLALLELENEFEEITNNGAICQTLEKTMPSKFKNW
jgi:hypothetical protein